MEVAVILYVIAAVAMVVWCSIPRAEPSVNYVMISRTMLNCLRKWNDDLVVVELCRKGKNAIQGALSVPGNQLPLLLRWMPPRTTLVLCGASEAVLHRGEIAMTLLGLGIEVVFVLEHDREHSTAPTTPWVPIRLP